jgi:IS1 family transposase
VDRRTSYLIQWAISPQRDPTLLQTLVDQAPPARFYYSDLYAGWRSLLYWHGLYTPMPNKSQTYRVEGLNAELRHYLARLTRQSRAFSKSLAAFRHAITLFAYLWNTRQAWKARFPTYPYRLADFV